MSGRYLYRMYTSIILNNVLTFSTCSVVNGPEYLCLAKSALVGMWSSQYVKALR